MYIVLATGQIGKVASICVCPGCKERGETEVFVNKLNGNYLDCIRFSNLFDKSFVLNIGTTIEELSYEKDPAEFNRIIADLYQKQLLEN